MRMTPHGIVAAWSRRARSSRRSSRSARELAAALPRASRHPLKALDDKAMDLASQDAELRPRCSASSTSSPPAARSTTSRATSPASSTRSTSRRRRSARRCGWATAAPGARRSAPPPRPASATWRTASSSARRRATRSACCATCGSDGVATSVDLLGEATVTARRGRPLRRSAAPTRSTTLAASTRRWPARPLLERDSRRPAPAREPVGQGLRAHAAAAPRRARARQARRRPAPARAAAPRARAAARTCTSTWSRSTRARRSSSSSSSCSPSTSSATARRPGVVLQAYLRDSPEHARPSSPGRARRRARAHAARRPAGQGRLLGPRGRRGAPARLERAGVRGQGRLRPQLRGAHARGCSTRAPGCVRVAIASHNLRSVAHAIADNRAARRRRRRPRAPGPARPRRRPAGRRSPPQGLRVRAYCPVGDLVAGMAYLVRRLLENTTNDSFLHEQARGRAARGAAGRAVSRRCA